MAQTNGRDENRPREFDTFAGPLWLEEKIAAKGRIIDKDGLERIAKKLDAAGFIKPADYLEKAAKISLNIHNRNHGNSSNKITSWLDLVRKGDKDQLAAMRKILSRCASNSRK